MEQLVILVLIGLISLINWAIRRSAEMRAQRRLERAQRQGEPLLQTRSAPPPMPEEEPAESMRKLMEALGLPTGGPPPAVAQPQHPVGRPHPPAVRKSHPQPKPRPQVVSQAPPGPSARRVPPLPATSVSKQCPPSPLPEGRFRKVLHQRGSLRDAIVLKEILGTPVGLRD